MKIKNIYFAALLALTFIGCSDDEFSTAIGEGTLKSPYRIWSKEQLIALADSAAQGLTQGRYYIQVKDIQLDGSETNPWKPIGYYDRKNSNHTPFMGTYDGDGHKISGLYIHNECDSTVGLFGFALGATIKDLTVSGEVFSSKRGVGGICGYSYHSTIENCTNNANVTGQDYYTGGICGYVYGNPWVSRSTYLPDAPEPIKEKKDNKFTSRSTQKQYCNGFVKKCTNNGAISADEYTGGICGYIYNAEVRNCKNTAKVLGNYDGIGGICGANYDYSLVTYCQNTGEIISDSTNSNYIGGICGDSDSDGRISFCENQGSVFGNECVGGISGYSDGIENCTNQGSVFGIECIGGISGYNSYNNLINCINSGQIGSSEILGNTVGGIIGETSTKILNCYNTGSIFGHHYVGGIMGESGILINVYNAGTITGDSIVCGIGFSGDINIAYNIGSLVSNNPVYGIQYSGSANYTFWLESTGVIGNNNIDKFCSAFNTEQTLTTPIVINNVSHSILLESLNATIELYKLDCPEIKSWKINQSQNNGYPIFED